MDELKLLKNRIDKTIMIDRDRYNDVYNSIEEFIETNNLILGGKIGLYMLLGKPRSVDPAMYNYEIYTETGIISANNLVNLIAKNFDKFISLKTVIPNEKYVIQYDNRNIATLFNLRKGSFDIIKPIYAKCFSSERQLYVIPGELYLLDVYRTLYTPGMASEWEATLKDEKRLFKHLKAREKIVKGSAEPLETAKSSDIASKLLKEYISNNTNIILVGDLAASLLLGSVEKVNIIQIFSSDSFDEIIADVEKILGKVSYKINKLHIMKDFRLERLSVKYNEKEVLYVYNSAHYDIIPFNKIIDASGNKFIFTGNPFVVMRSILIESWIIREHLARKTIDEHYGKRKLDVMLNKMLAIRKNLGSSVNYTGIQTESEIKHIHDANMNIFQNDEDDYLGQYEPENKAIKEISGEGKKYYDYYPQKYYQTNGKYREI